MIKKKNTTTSLNRIIEIFFYYLFTFSFIFDELLQNFGITIIKYIILIHRMKIVIFIIIYLFNSSE